MRISDWSSDVCSSDLTNTSCQGHLLFLPPHRCGSFHLSYFFENRQRRECRSARKSVVEGKSVSVSVDLGGRRIIKQKKNKRDRENNKMTKMYTYTRHNAQIKETR